MGCKSDLFYRSQCWCNRSMRSFRILFLQKSLFIQSSVDLTRWDDMTGSNYTQSFHPLYWSGSCHTVSWGCADQATGVPVWEPAVKHRPHFNALYLRGPTFDFGCSRELAPLSWLCPPQNLYLNIHYFGCHTSAEIAQRYDENSCKIKAQRWDAPGPPDRWCHISQQMW